MNTIYKSILLVAIFSVAGCNSKKEAISESLVTEVQSVNISVSKKQFEASGMVEGQLEKRTFDKAIRVNGQIALPNKSKAVVSSMMSGTIGAINLIEGQWVKKGQKLLSISNPELIDLQEQYLVLQSKTNYLREEQARKQNLVNENLVGKQELLLAQSEYQINEAMHKTVSQKLQLYGVNVNTLTKDNLRLSVPITAPISGYVTKISAIRGQYTDPATEVISIASKSNMFLALNVLERDAALIRKDQEVSYTLASDPKKTYQAKVYLINTSVNEQGMLTVHCSMSDSKDLLPGMYATADLILDKYESDALPEEAIVQIEGKSHVLVQSNKANGDYQYLPQSIDVGVIKDGFVELTNGTELNGKSVLVKGGYYLVN